MLANAAGSLLASRRLIIWIALQEKPIPMTGNPFASNSRMFGSDNLAGAHPRIVEAVARHSGGFGLGLSITRDLVRAMGGGVTAERLAEGGSRFVVTLPLAHR